MSDVMNYLELVNSIIKNICSDLVDFSKPRDNVRKPTQASSNFITNKEQGDWAENLVFQAINNSNIGYVAVKYGKSDDIVAGEEGFDEFYEEFQQELDTIGKRPDILIFKKSDFNQTLGNDISKLPYQEIDDYVKKAIAGIEIRSSAFLIDKYESEMRKKYDVLSNRVLEIKDDIISNYSEELNDARRIRYLDILNSITKDNLDIVDFRVPSWRATTRLGELTEKFKELKKCLSEIHKRSFLSITPKMEDLKVVYKWIETYNVPHFYFQVFFDKIYAISFLNILSLMSNPDKEGVDYFIESDVQNQNKTTIKINSKQGALIAHKVDEPEHSSVRKELDRGRLLFYVTFKGGVAYLNIDNLTQALNIKSTEISQ